MLVVGGRPGEREHGRHRGEPADRVDRRVVRVEDRDPVHAVAAASVVVILGHQQIARCSRVGRNHRRRHDRLRVVPPERAGGLLNREILVEVRQPAARTVRVPEDAVVDVAVGTDQGRRRADVDHGGVRAAFGIFQQDLILGRERGGVERDEVAEASVAHGDVKRFAIVAERGRAIHRDLVDVRIARGGRGGDIRRRAVGRDPRDAALQAHGRRAVDLVPEVDVPGGVPGDRRGDEDFAVVRRRVLVVVRLSVEDQSARDRRVRRVRRIDHRDLAADRRDREPLRRVQTHAEAGEPGGSGDDVVRGDRPEQRPVPLVPPLDHEIAGRRGLDGHQERPGGRDRGSSVMRVQHLAREHRVQVDRRAPADRFERLRRHGRKRGVLGVAAISRPGSVQQRSRFEPFGMETKTGPAARARSARSRIAEGSIAHDVEIPASGKGRAPE